MERVILVSMEIVACEVEAHDLLDASRENVQALVQEGDIQDTDRVDKVGFTIPPESGRAPSEWIGRVCQFILTRIACSLGSSQKRWNAVSRRYA